MKINEIKDCLACRNSYSAPAKEINEEYDRLYCMIRQKYVEEDGYCDDFN